MSADGAKAVRPADRALAGLKQALVGGDALKQEVALAGTKNEAKPRGRPFQPGVKAGPGRAKGQPNRVTATIREAVELAAQQCHPAGFAGWLVERAQGGIEDRKIFAGVVARAMPIQAAVKSDQTITINLPWLQQRGLGTRLAQSRPDLVQVVDVQGVPTGGTRISNQPTSPEGGGGQGDQGQGDQASSE